MGAGEPGEVDRFGDDADHGDRHVAGQTTGYAIQPARDLPFPHTYLSPASCRSKAKGPSGWGIRLGARHAQARAGRARGILIPHQWNLYMRLTGDAAYTFLAGNPFSGVVFVTRLKQLIHTKPGIFQNRFFRFPSRFEEITRAV